MSRAPVYSKDRQSRVISVANGLWQLQSHNGDKGTATYDPWYKRGVPSDLETVLIALGPTK